MGKSYSFAGTIVTGATKVGAFTVPHDLERPPADAFIVYRSGSAAISRGAVQWDDENIYLTATAAGTVFKLFLFGQEAKTVTTRVRPFVVYGWTTNPWWGSGAWPDGATNTMALETPIPDDWSGDITIKLLRTGLAANTAKMTWTTARTRDGARALIIDNAVNIDFTPGTTNDTLLTRTVSSTNFQAGDSLFLELARQGAAGGDTMVGTVHFRGAWIEYTST